MHQLKIHNLNLKATIESGQVFRYEKVNDSYFLPLRNTLFELKQEGNILYWDAAHINGKQITDQAVIHLLRLDEDYDHIIEEISKDKHMKKIIKQYKGLRLIRQDPWECLISFLSTMVSNIPKHSSQLKKLCELYGQKIMLNGFTSYTFPQPGKLDNEQVLRTLGFGFRAPFIVFANNLITDKNIAGVKLLPYGEAKVTLTKFRGIGNKIADCALLFSFDQLEAFPVDVWIKRVMEELYFKETVKERVVEEFGRSYFGRYAGYAQQFLYHWRRFNSS